LSVYLAYVQSTKDDPTVLNISARERQVLQLLAEGASTKDAAIQLEISVKTAGTHRSNLMQKLDLHSMAEVVLFAVRNGIIQVPVGGIDSAVGQRSVPRALA
jgi:DNA-binding NarL/FixJ family response regulator